METRKFAIGDQVRVRLDSYNSENPTDVYTISRVLPVMAKVGQYRVKRVGDGQERGRAVAGALDALRRHLLRHSDDRDGDEFAPPDDHGERQHSQHRHHEDGDGDADSRREEVNHMDRACCHELLLHSSLGS